MTAPVVKPIDLADGNVVLLRIQSVMDLLQQACPALKFHAGNGGVYTPKLDVNGWTRGGTSPSGQELGNVQESNWFVGDTYLKASVGYPWRIIWLPPLADQEKFVPGEATGRHYADQFNGGDAAMGLDSRGLGFGGYRKILNRVSPWKIHLWANDWTDLDMLVHWVAACVHGSAPGAAEALREPTIASGGYAINVEAGMRGVAYMMTVNFVFPIIAPITAPGGSANSAQGVADADHLVVTRGRLV